MNNEVITIEKEKCAALAELFFLSSSGLEKETEKNINVRKAAYRVRKHVDAMLDIRAVFSFCDALVIDGKILDINGQKFMCDPFGQIRTGEVEAAVPFFITAGDVRIDDMQVSDQVIADLWANAYLQAAISLFRDYLEKQYGKLSDQFGPGLYGMSEGSARRLARLADMREIGISLNERGIMAPTKSCCGLFFIVKGEYKNPGTECLYCKGKTTECAGCSVIHKRKQSARQLIKLPLDFFPDDGKTGYGLAVDIGTTSLVVVLWDLSRAAVKATVSDYNPQTEYGMDVITRLMWVLKKENGLARMREKVLYGINSLIVRACEEAGIDKGEICKAVMAGNTVMSHFFAGIDPTGLAEAPFKPAYEGLIRMKGKKAGLKIADEAEVILVPNIAGYVGGDITAGLIATGINRNDQTSLFIDLGTNGEIVLISETGGVVCSTAAGSAFEGAGLSCGMRASQGAIERIYLKDDELCVVTIGGVKAAGICGSGLVDAVSFMLETNLMDRNGKIKGNEFRIPGLPDIYISQDDVRKFQLAKGAIAAGVQICLEGMDKEEKEIDQIIIGGAFAANTSVMSAMNTGIIPRIDENKVNVAGNTSVAGASMILLSSEEVGSAEKVSKSLRHIELADSKKFQEMFLKCMSF